jgi:hypothetical protein
MPRLHGAPRSLGVALVALVMASCGGAGSSAPPGSSPYIDGFNPRAVPAGATRFVTPTITNIQPGDDKLYCQWLAAPAETDQDVLALSGQQSPHGHHVVLYATTANEPVGTSRECTSEDMVAVRFLGGAGGEGVNAVQLPAGVVFRLPKGQALMANVHFINPTSQTIEGQAVIDATFAAPDASRQIANMFVNTTVSLTIPAHASGYTVDLKCKAQRDLPLLLMADHMHAYGVAAHTDVIRSSGQTDSLVSDATWSSELQFNPKFASFPVGQPMVIHAGDVVHTQCTWNGDANKALTFPTEMCAGIGFYVVPSGGTEVACVDGQWPSR